MKDTKNTAKAASTEREWMFHGLRVTKAEYDQLKNLVNDKGQCPFCRKTLRGRYANANKHIRKCLNETVDIHGTWIRR